MAAQPTLLKVTVLHYRNQSHDEATWMKWWNEEHMPCITPIAIKHGIERVELYFTPSSFKKQFQDDLDRLKGGSEEGWKMAPYDAASSYWTTDFQNIRNMLADPDWATNVTNSSEGWLDTKRADVQIGMQSTFVENGKLISGSPSDLVASYIK